MNILKDKFYLPTIFLFFVSFIWFSKIFYIWDHDTGLWYLISNHFNKDYVPYSNEFDNKGPLFFLFIKFVSSIIGYGVYQAYVLYSLTIFLFFLILLYLLNKKNLNYQVFWLLIISFSSIFFLRKPHIVFILFYYSFFIPFIYCLINSIVRKNSNYLFLSVVFFSLSSIILIDVYLYSLILILTHIYIFLFNKKKISEFILYAFLYFLVYLIINYLPKIYYGYDFKDFFLSYFLYNQSSHSSGPVNSIQFAYFLILTLILPLFIITIFYSKFLSVLFKRFDYFIIALFILITIFKYFYFSDGSGGRYLLYLYIPLIYFIIHFSEFIKINKIILFFSLIIMIFVHGKNLAPPILKNIVQHKCFINFFCDAPSYANLFKGTVDYLNKNKDKKYYFVDINSWILVITNSDFHGVVNNYYIYSCKSGNCTHKIENNEPFETDGLLEAHNKFISGNYGSFVIYDWGFIRNTEQLSKYWRQIKKIEKSQKSLGHFYLSEIRKIQN